MPQTVEEILSAAKKAGASDVHITVGIPPKMRVNGKLIMMEGERLMPADTMTIAESVMNDVQKVRFEGVPRQPAWAAAMQRRTGS